MAEKVYCGCPHCQANPMEWGEESPLEDWPIEELRKAEDEITTTLNTIKELIATKGV